MGKRFRVVSLEEAQKYEYPGADEFADADDYDRSRTCLYEFKDERPVRLVGHDGGEPEDNTLTRDWFWVVAELNKLAEEGR